MKVLTTKEMTCSRGHEFDRKECKETWQGMYPCPVCWPNGFLNKKVENETPDLSNLRWVNGDGSPGS